MKCQVCGFVSFDNLAECRKCGADLTESRERLGFSTLKSQVPFLLGALLKGEGKRDNPKDPFGTGIDSKSTESATGFNPERSPNRESVIGKPATAPGYEEGAPGKEELIIELSEADLESLCGNKEPLKGKDPRKSQS